MFSAVMVLVVVVDIVTEVDCRGTRVLYVRELLREMAHKIPRGFSKQYNSRQVKDTEIVVVG